MVFATRPPILLRRWNFPMKTRPIKSYRHGREVWENPTLEAIRREECLCWSCERMKPGTPDHCETAQSLFEICKAKGVAFPVSRCPDFVERPKSPVSYG